MIGSTFVETWVPEGRGGVVYDFSGEVRPRHHHDELEFNLGVRGVGRLGVGERTVEITPGRLIWFLPGQDHVLEARSRDFQMWIVPLRRSLVDRFLSRSRHTSLPSLANQVRSLATRDFATLSEICSGSRFGTHDATDERLLLLLERALSSSNAGAAPGLSAHPRVDRCLRSLAVEPNLSREALAARFGVAPASLSRSFRQSFGMSLPEYKNRLRLGRFLDTVRNGESNLLRAALNAGFGSYAQFQRVLREHTGVTPTAFARAETRIESMRETTGCDLIDDVTM